MNVGAVRFFNWRLASFVLDCAVAASSFLIAYALVFNWHHIPQIPGLVQNTLIFTAVSAVSFLVFSTHRGSWRFVSLPEMLSLVKATAAAVIVYTTAAFLISRGMNVPRSVPVLTGFLLVAGLAGPRILYRLAVEGQLLRPLGGRRDKDVRPVLVLGYTSAADSFIRASHRSAATRYHVIGLLDDKVRSQSMQGVRIYGRLSDLESVVGRLTNQGLAPVELVVAEIQPDRQRLVEIVERATAAGLKASRIADPTNTSSVDPNALDPRPIELSDLLGRPEVRTDIQSVASLIRDKVVLVTGAGGSIGSELVRQIAHFEPKLLILTDNSEHNTYVLDTEIRERFPDLKVLTQLVSVRDARRLNMVFASHRPEVVFHAAALKHVPIVEQNPIEGIKTNVLGTRNAANAALAHGTATFVMISTDKAVNPTNVMGATKRAAEAYCQALDISSSVTRFKTVRFGNVLGSNGSVVPRFQEQILAGGPVTVTHPEIVRYFMTIPEAVRLVLHASSRTGGDSPKRGKIMVLDMGKPVRIVDLAERMIQLAGFRPGIDIKVSFIGPRPGEKLFEELFDPSEMQDPRTEDGYVFASPRVMDGNLLVRTMANLEKATEEEDDVRAIELLRHIVPEYRPSEDVAKRQARAMLDGHKPTLDSAIGFCPD